MIYHVTVKPGSFKDEVISDISSPNCLIVKTRKKAHDGEANTAVVKLLADYFHVAKTTIIIKKGATSPHKILEIKR